MRRQTTITTITILTVLIAAGEAHCGTVDVAFTKIVDTNTPYPGSTGTFNYLYNPSISEGYVSFRGARVSYDTGIFSVDPSATMTAVVRSSDPLFGNGYLNGFYSFYVAADGADVAFPAQGSFGANGIFASVGGTIKRIADLNTAIPGGTGFFTGFNLDANTRVAIDDGNVVFRGDGSNGQQGIYVGNGNSLSKVADRNTFVPNYGYFGSFGPMAIDAGVIAFQGSSRTNLPGIFLSEAGGFTMVSSERATSLAYQDNVLAFLSPSSVYRYVDGSAIKIADTKTAVPDGAGNTFSWFYDVSTADGFTAFSASDAMNVKGIYTDIGGGLSTVVRGGDLLDDKIVDSVVMSCDGLDDSQIAFKATFTDGSVGIYVAHVTAPVPEPTTLAIWSALGGLGMIAARRRRKVA